MYKQHSIEHVANSFTQATEWKSLFMHDRNQGLIRKILIVPNDLHLT